VFNPIAFVKIQYKMWKERKHLEGLISKTNGILGQCVEILNEKKYFVESLEIVTKLGGFAIIVHFDPTTAVLPELFDGAYQENTEDNKAMLVVMVKGTAEMIVERALDLYIWCCCIIRKDFDKQHGSLMEEVLQNVNDFQDSTDVRRILRSCP